MAMKLGISTKYENMDPPRVPFYPPMMIGSPAMRDHFCQINPYQ